MVQKIIDIGSAPNAGNGDLVRAAMSKINDNFIEVYHGPTILTQAEIDQLTPTGGRMVYNATTGKFQGYAEDAEDSTPGWVDLH
jgi:hypothetical protein|tara:strand:- start:463 stop:714 length:252 start_codon:yes stop_codon:yes gene_type:complete